MEKEIIEKIYSIGGGVCIEVWDDRTVHIHARKEPTKSVAGDSLIEALNSLIEKI